MDAKMLPVQCKMARTALNLGVRELAVLAKVSTNTITRFEGGDAKMKDRTVDDIRTALEAAGVTFLESGDVSTGAGVSLRKDEA